MKLGVAVALATTLALVATGCREAAVQRPSTEATVGIRASGCGLTDQFGTGVAIGPHLIATSAHTVAGARDVTVIDQAQHEHLAQVVGFDSDQDVSILRIDGNVPFAPLGRPSSGDSGTLAKWHPDRGFTTGEISVVRLLRVTIEDIYIMGQVERSAFEIEADVVPGDSGGPVFNDDGTVAGIIYANSRDRDGVAFALQSVEIDRLVQATGETSVDNGRCV